MPECPVCRRAFDDRFSVFAPPSGEPFDTIECARRATGVASGEAGDATPLILPTIDVLASLGGQAKATGARDPVVGAGLRGRLPVPIAVAAGLSLVAVGTASSLYVWSGLPQYGRHATRTAAPLTAPSAPSAGATIPPTLQGSSTRNAGPPAAEPVALTSSQPAQSSEVAGTTSSPVEPTVGSPPPQPPPPPPPASATQPPSQPASPPAPSSPPPSQPQPQPPQPQPAPPPSSPPPSQPQPSPEPPTDGGKNPDAGGAGHGTTGSTAVHPPKLHRPPVRGRDDDDAGKHKDPHPKPKPPPVASSPGPPSGALPAVPATPAQASAHSVDEGAQHGASESPENGKASLRDSNNHSSGSGKGKGEGKHP